LVIFVYSELHSDSIQPLSRVS